MIKKYKVFKYNKKIFFIRESDLIGSQGVLFKYSGKYLILVNKDLSAFKKQGVLHKLIKSTGNTVI